MWAIASGREKAALVSARRVLALYFLAAPTTASQRQIKIAFRKRTRALTLSRFVLPFALVRNNTTASAASFSFLSRTHLFNSNIFAAVERRCATASDAASRNREHEHFSFRDERRQARYIAIYRPFNVVPSACFRHYWSQYPLTADEQCTKWPGLPSRKGIPIFLSLKEVLSHPESLHSNRFFSYVFLVGHACAICSLFAYPRHH